MHVCSKLFLILELLLVSLECAVYMIEVSDSNAPTPLVFCIMPSTGPPATDDTTSGPSGHEAATTPMTTGAGEPSGDPPLAAPLAITQADTTATTGAEEPSGDSAPPGAGHVIVASLPASSSGETVWPPMPNMQRPYFNGFRC